MNSVVIYKSRYGSTKKYAQWIAEELACDVFDAKKISAADLAQYDTIIYGGGLYGEVICGVNLITKNLNLLKNKKIAVFSTGITPLDCREYYDKMVIEKNFKNGLPENVKVFNFLGKMILDELSFPHRAAIKALKKFMSSKEKPSDMEKLLIELCDADGDFTNRAAIKELIEYAQ